MTGPQFAEFVHIFNDIDNDVKEFRNKKLDSFKHDIGDGVFVTASNGFALVHIRLYYQNEDMPIALPTKTGIALRFDEWDALVNVVENVQKRIELI